MLGVSYWDDKLSLHGSILIYNVAPRNVNPQLTEECNRQTVVERNIAALANEIVIPWLVTAMMRGIRKRGNGVRFILWQKNLNRAAIDEDGIWRVALEKRAIGGGH